MDYTLRTLKKKIAGGDLVNCLPVLEFSNLFNFAKDIV